MTGKQKASANPVGALTLLSDELGSAAGKEFTRQWMRRAFVAEFARYTIEDDYVDPASAPYTAARRALDELMESDDWLSPKVGAFLEACQEIANGPNLEWREVRKELESAGRTLTILEWQPKSAVPMTVSNAYAKAVQVIERSLGDPQLCAGMIAAFADRIAILKESLGATHLAFVEKEAGPVGAITMMASLVEATRLPACVYRETHWAASRSLAGQFPGKDDRVVIVYDLIVSGAGVCHAADKIRGLTGATTVGTVVLCGYQERRGALITEGDQNIRVEALGWDDSIVTLGDELVDGGVGEARIKSAPRAAPLKDPTMTDDDDVPGDIPPGSYSRDTLPEIGEGARRILERVQAYVRIRQSASTTTTTEPDVIKRRRPSEAVEGFHPTEALGPSLRRVARGRRRKSKSQSI